MIAPIAAQFDRELPVQASRLEVLSDLFRDRIGLFGWQQVLRKTCSNKLEAKEPLLAAWP